METQTPSTNGALHFIDADTFRKIHPHEYLRRFTSQGVRPDGRTFEKFRPTLINTGSISTANGSALVRIGNTMVVCGIKAEIAEPTLDHPRRGYVIPNVDLSPICSPKFRPGPPPEEAQVASERLNQILSKSSPLDLESLSIEEGKAVWCLYADIVVLNFDGNVLDTSLLAMITALLDCKLPTAEWDPDSSKTICYKDMIPLKLSKRIYSASFCVFADNILADPTDAEESLCDEQLTIAIDDTGRICMMFKSGGLSTPQNVLQKCIQAAKQRWNEIADIVGSL